MKLKHVIFVAALLLPSISAIAETSKSHAVSIYGDIKYPASFKHFEYVNPDAPKRGEIILPEIGSFDSLNPYILKGKTAAGVDLLFDTLMSGSKDETATSYGLIAKTVEIADDNSYVIFNLNRKAKFSDGSQVTADDVVFTFNALLEKGHPVYKIYYGEIGPVSKLSKYRVKFELKNPRNRELKYILGDLPVLSKAYYEKEDFEKTTLKAPLGSGPYMVETIDQGRQITYIRRDDYWAKDLPTRKGMYNYDKVKYEYYLDANVAIQAFKSGALDLRYENIAKNWANAYNIEAVRTGKIKKEKIHHQIPVGMQAFAFNIRRDKLKNRNVRKALSMALDFEWMNKNLFFNSYDRTTSYFQNSIYASSGLPSEAELELLEPFRDQLPEEVFTEEFKLDVSDGSGYIRDRLVKARDILAAEGWVIKDGKLQKDGEQMKLEFLVIKGGSIDRLMPSIFENLKILGVEATLREADLSQYKQRRDEFDYDIVTAVWGQGNSPGNEQINYWQSSSADTTGSRNYIGIKSEVVDALIDKLLVAQTKDELITIIRALDRVLLRGNYVMPHFNAGYFRVLHWDKFDKPKTRPKYDGEFGLWTWWVK